MQGLVLYHLGRAREAEDALRGALVLVPRWGTPSHAEVHAMSAVIRAGAGDEIGARELVSKIIESAHSFSAGLVHAALGDADAAFAAFDQVRRWDSFRPSISVISSPPCWGRCARMRATGGSCAMWTALGTIDRRR